jgi:hypothetical protein
MKIKTQFQLFVLIAVISSISGMAAQSTFSVTYSFNNSRNPVVTAGAEAVIGDSAVWGGTKLGTTSYITDEFGTAWRGQIVKSNSLNFEYIFLKVPLYAKAGYKINVQSVKVSQRSSKVGANNNFKIGATLNGTIPISGQFIGGTLTSSYNDTTYTPASALSVSGLDYVSIWLAGRGNTTDTFYWDVNEVTITGTYEPVAGVDYVIDVSENLKQNIRLGVDCSTLWYWRSNLKTQLAQIAVGEMNTDFLRVQINTAYEREQGIKNDSVYYLILELMTAMHNANPNIKFFSSPSTLSFAYTDQEKVEIWGHVDNVPFSCFPAWILHWDQDGTKTMSDGTVVPVWKRGYFDYPALTQYYADYLNMMYQKGFDISYLDLSNEQSVITPAITKYIYDNLPAKLLPGVRMPELVVPSTWNVQGGIDWLDSVNVAENEDQSFSVAAVHNTGTGGSEAEFASKASLLGKEAWNTELHNWVGLTLHDDIMTSEALWYYLRSGFTGIETWLFFGDWGGKPHSMIWTKWNGTTIIKTGKYEIFKQVVNNANGGNYLEVSMPYSSVPTVAFLKDNILSVWILNKTPVAMPNTTFNVLNKNIMNKTIDVVKWNRSIATTGQINHFVNQETDKFSYDIDPQSLYFFKIDLSQANALTSNYSESCDFLVSYSPKLKEVKIQINALNKVSNGDYSVFNVAGQCVKSGKISGTEGSFSSIGMAAGVYIVEVKNKLQKAYYKKLLIYN